MRAEIITSGTELLLGEIVDTNAAYLSRELAALGVDVFRRTTIGDNPQRIAGAIRAALEGNDLVVVTGGLGPTEDDCTAEALADAVGEPLVLNEQAGRWVEEWLAERNRTTTERDLKQARMPKDAAALMNRRGSAPGILWRGKVSGRTVMAVALPGVPAEMEGMFRDEVRPLLAGSGAVIRTKVLHVVGLTEPEIDRRLGGLWRHKNPTVGVCARPGQVEIRLTAKAESAEAAREALEGFAGQVRAALGPVVFGSGPVTLEAAVGHLLKRRGLQLAVAESCTGGLIGDRLTDVPGSSQYLDRVLVVYANRAKTDLLGVPEAVLASQGAVSSETARLMAEGLLRYGVDVGLSVTGIAGPDGGSAAKPVGLVYVAVADGRGTEVRELRLGTDRRTNKHRAATSALALLWQRLGGGEVRPKDVGLEEDDG